MIRRVTITVNEKIYAQILDIIAEKFENGESTNFSKTAREILKIGLRHHEKPVINYDMISIPRFKS